MSAATNAATRDPRARYEGGFDRWNRETRMGWSVVCREADTGVFALGDAQSVWVWDNAGRIWQRVDGQTAMRMLRDHGHAMHRLRRAVLVVKLLNSKMGGERGAARGALQRIGSGIVADWQLGTSEADAAGQGWLDHPASIYLAVTRDCRFHLVERERMAFDPSIYAWLVAAAQEDFLAGRRAQPPRLRPDDLVRLQANFGAGDPEHETIDFPEPPITTPVRPDDEARIVAQQAERDHIARLREALAESVNHEVNQEASAQQRRRRRFWLVSGSLAATVLVAVLRFSVF